jgi:hypothetical protein
MVHMLKYFGHHFEGLKPCNHIVFEKYWFGMHIIIVKKYNMIMIAIAYFELHKAFD